MKQRLLLGSLILLFALTACSGSTAGQTNPAPVGSITVNVTETEFQIGSSLTHFTPGVAYHFIVTNNGQIAHEFMIMPKNEGNMTSNMGAMDSMALARIDNIDPGATKTLDYTFPASLAGSHPEFACYLPGHYVAGMKEDITVQTQ